MDGQRGNASQQQHSHDFGDFHNFKLFYDTHLYGKHIATVRKFHFESRTHLGKPLLIPAPSTSLTPGS